MSARPHSGTGGSGGWSVAPPLGFRQHRVGVGVLLEHEPAIPPALAATADPVQDPQFPQVLQRAGDRADAHAGLDGDRRVRRDRAQTTMVHEMALNAFMRPQRNRQNNNGAQRGAVGSTREGGSAALAATGGDSQANEAGSDDQQRGWLRNRSNGEGHIAASAGDVEVGRTSSSRRESGLRRGCAKVGNRQGEVRGQRVHEKGALVPRADSSRRGANAQRQVQVGLR
jgi:hypothetical protein